MLAVPLSCIRRLDALAASPARCLERPSVATNGPASWRPTECFVGSNIWGEALPSTAYDTATTSVEISYLYRATEVDVHRTFVRLSPTLILQRDKAREVQNAFRLPGSGPAAANAAQWHNPPRLPCSPALFPCSPFPCPVPSCSLANSSSLTSLRHASIVSNGYFFVKLRNMSGQGLRLVGFPGPRTWSGNGRR